MHASYKTNEFHDIDQYMECAARTMEIRSIQIEPGLLSLTNHFLELDGLFIQYYSTNRDLLDHFSIRPKHLLFSLTPTIDYGCKWCGIDVPVNSIGVLHPQREHQALMPANWDSFGIMIKDEVVLQEALLSEHLLKQTVQPEKAIFNHQSSHITSFRSKLLGYFRSPGMLDILIENESAKMELKDWILDELRMIFSGDADNQSGYNTSVRNPSRRYKIFTRALALIEESIAEQISVKQICDQIGTTPRTLQLCFKELTGISPRKYITARKLHAVQQELFSLNNSTIPISHIAHDYGLLNSGRFSSQYKRMFSEFPHEMLKRRNRFNEC